MANYPSIFAWRIPWTEEPGRLQSMGRKGIYIYIYIYIYILSHHYPLSLTSIVNTRTETNILKRYCLEKRMPELEDEWMCKWQVMNEWANKFKSLQRVLIIVFLTVHMFRDCPASAQGQLWHRLAKEKPQLTLLFISPGGKKTWSGS